MNDITQLTCDLIRIASTSENVDENKKALAYIEDYLDFPQEHVTWHTETAHPSLVFTLLPHQHNHEIILHGHTDVVPGEESLFTPKVVDNKIYGRGATDMKGGLAVQVALFKSLYKKGLQKPLTLMITSDEELGGGLGAKHLFSTKEYRASFFLSGEGQQHHRIITKAKGIVFTTIHAEGVPAHGSRIWQGENAIEKLFHALQDIKELFPQKDDEEHWYSTVNLSQIKGGEAINSVPKHVSATIDIRFTEQWPHGDAIIQRIKEVLKKHPGVWIDEPKTNEPMVHADATNPHVQKLTAAFLRHTSHVTVPHGISHGTSDARFAAAHGIPAVEYGPQGYHAHHHDEYIEIQELERYYHVCESFIESL